MKFVYRGNQHECEDKFQLLAVDRDGDVWLYDEEPILKLDEGYWDPTGESSKMPERGCNAGWATSLVAIFDLQRATGNEGQN